MFIKNLVFSGGGAKGFAYIGVLKALEEFKLTKNIKKIIGVSIGSMFGTLLSLGFNSKELLKFMTILKIHKRIL